VADAQEVPAGTEIKSLGTVDGGPGVYRVNISQTVPTGTTIRGLNDNEIRLQGQTFAVASGTGSIAPDLASLPLSRGILTVNGDGWATGLTLDSPTAGAVLSGTVIIDDLGYNATAGGHQYRVSRSQTLPLGPLTGNSTATRYFTARIVGDALTISRGSSLALGQGLTGITDGVVLPGTVVTEVVGGGVYKVNLSQEVPAGTKMRTIATGLPWAAAARGGGDSEGVTNYAYGVIWPEGARGLVARIPAGRDYLCFVWQGPEGIMRTLSVRDLDPAGSGSLRIQASISSRCEEDQ
jgi:hypothetical protein